MTIQITPDNAVMLPDDPEDEQPENSRQAVDVSSTTAMVLQELGMGFDMSPEDEKKAQELFKDLHARNPKNLPAELNTPEVAAKVGALLRHYDHQIVSDAAQLRTVITNKLILLADCGDPRFELKALEMLGKISDVGLFTEKSEVTVVHKTTEALEEAIRDKVRRLIHSNTIDVEPLIPDLEAELLEKEDAGTDTSGAASPVDDTSDVT